MNEAEIVMTRLNKVETEGIEPIFHELVQKWHSEIGVTSSLEAMILKPSYQQIIGLGPPTIPLLIHELQTKPHHWFHALAAITREDPVLPEHWGDLGLMTEDWLNWARERSYLRRC